MGVSKNSGTPKSSILIGFSIINHPFWGPTPIFGNIHVYIYIPLGISLRCAPCVNIWTVRVASELGGLPTSNHPDVKILPNRGAKGPQKGILSNFQFIIQFFRLWFLLVWEWYESWYIILLGQDFGYYHLQSITWTKRHKTLLLIDMSSSSFLKKTTGVSLGSTVNL